MKQENFNYLDRQVKFTGFGEGLSEALKTNMEAGAQAFQLTHNHKFGRDETNATLHFRYAESTGNYYFNNYDLSVKGGKDNTVSQKFYVDRNNTFTLKEACNLLMGRSVNKDLVNRQGQEYNSWVKLDFKDTDDNGNFKLKHFTENYGYKLDEALAKHPIKELTNEEDKGKLIASLYKGNRQQVTFISDGKEQKGFIEANPQYKTVTVYDQNMKRVDQSEKQRQTGSTAKAEKQKQSDESDDGPRKSKKQGKRKSPKIS